MRIKSVFKHGAQALAEGSLIALLVVGLMAGSVLAAKPESNGQGKPGGGGSSSLSVTVTTDADGNGLPNWADRVHFDVITSNAYPIVSLTCYQGGALVYSDSRPYYWPNIWDDPGIFTLSSLSWASGSADCSADLKGTSNRRTVTLATTSFNVGA